MWAKINDGAQAMFEKVTGKEAPERFKRSNSSRRFSTLSFFKPAQEKPLTESSSALPPSPTESQAQPRSQPQSRPTQDAASSSKATEHQPQVSPAPAMSSPPIKNVMIAGATGHAGQPILTALLSSPQYTVSILARHDSPSVYPPNVPVHRTDYTVASLTPLLAGTDCVVACLTGRACLLQLALIDACLAAGVRHYIPSEYGCNTSTTKSASLQKISLDALRTVEEKLKASAREDTAGGAMNEFHWTGINCGAFFDAALLSGFLDIDPRKRHAQLWDDGAVRSSMTTTTTLGAAVVAILSPAIRPKVLDRFVYIQSFAVSQKDILAALEKHRLDKGGEELGVEWTVTHTTSEDQMREAGEALGKGDAFGAFRRWIFAMMVDPQSGCDWSAKTENALLGLEPQSLQGEVEKVLHAIEGGK